MILLILIIFDFDYQLLCASDKERKETFEVGNFAIHDFLLISCSSDKWYAQMFPTSNNWQFFLALPVICIAHENDYHLNHTNRPYSLSHLEEAAPVSIS